MEKQPRDNADDTTWMEVYDSQNENIFESALKTALTYQAFINEQVAEGTLDEQDVDELIAELDAETGLHGTACTVTGRLDRYAAVQTIELSDGSDEDEGDEGATPASMSISVESNNVYVEDEPMYSVGFFASSYEDVDGDTRYIIQQRFQAQPEQTLHIPYTALHLEQPYYGAMLDNDIRVDPIEEKPRNDISALELFAEDLLADIDIALTSQDETDQSTPRRELLAGVIRQLDNIDLSDTLALAYAHDPDVQTKLSEYLNESLDFNVHTPYVMSIEGELCVLDDAGEEVNYIKTLHKDFLFTGIVNGMQIAALAGPDERPDHALYLSVQVPTDNELWLQALIPVDAVQSIERCPVFLEPGQA